MNSFAVLINGAPSSFFIPKRGLRQGFPLSPYLFLLAVEALRKLVLQEKRKGTYKRVLLTSTMELTHILFVDDVLLLGEGNLDNLQYLTQILNLYKQETGMEINIEK